MIAGHNKVLAKANCLYLLLNYISVDFQILVIFLVISLLNAHFLIYLNVYKSDFVSDHLNLPSMSLDERNIASLFGDIIDDKTLLDSKKCFAQTGSLYEYFLEKNWFWIDLTVYSLVPFAVMGISSLVILVKFRKINKNYTRMLTEKSHKFNTGNYFQKIKRNRQICLILLNSCFYFLFTMLQYWICFFLFRYNTNQLEIISELNSFVYIFLYTNNAFDFVIYGFSSEKYRAELVSLFDWRHNLILKKTLFSAQL